MKEGLPKNLDDYKTAEGITPEIEEANKRKLLSSVEEDLSSLESLAREELKYNTKGEMTPAEIKKAEKESEAVESNENEIGEAAIIEGMGRSLRLKIRKAVDSKGKYPGFKEQLESIIKEEAAEINKLFSKKKIKIEEVKEAFQNLSANIDFLMERF